MTVTNLNPSPAMKDSGVPWLQEVRDHAPDAWFDQDSIKTGYEISFTRYFYKPKPLRTPEEIRAGILALEKETEGLLGETIGSGKGGA